MTPPPDILTPADLEFCEKVLRFVRIDLRPAVPFQDFVRSRGYDPARDLPGDFEFADAVGSLLFPRPCATKADVAKTAEARAKLALRQRLLDLYRDAVGAGEIPTVPREAPLDLSRGCDRAYVRAMRRRALRTTAQQEEIAS